MLFWKLGEVYRNCMERYGSLGRKAAIYALAGGLMALSLAPLGCRKAPEAKPTEGTKTNEIAIATDHADKEHPGRIILLRYDGEKYTPFFEHEGLKHCQDVTIGDVDNDGINDVVACSQKASFLIRYKDGNFVSTKLDGEYETGVKSVVVGDADNDGKNEILVHESHHSPRFPSKLHFYEVDASDNIRKKSFQLGEVYRKLVRIGDVDGDGRNETLIASAYKGIVIGEFRGGKYRVERLIGYDWKKLLADYESKLKISGDSSAFTPERIEERRERFRNHIVQKALDECEPLGGYDGDFLPLLQEEAFIVGMSANGDIDGNGSRDILLALRYRDNTGSFGMIARTGKDYEYLTMEESLDPNAWGRCVYGYGCSFGDADNDGKLDAVVGLDRVMVFSYENGLFRKVWESEAYTGGMPAISSVCVADCDNDGLNEIIASVKKNRIKGYGIAERLIVWGNRGKGERQFYKDWESEDFPDRITIAVGDVDGK